MFNTASDKLASIILFLAAAFWGLYWLPLRAIEQVGVPGVWSVALFNLCPVIVLLPFVIWRRHSQWTGLRNVMLIGLMIGIGLSLYASGLVLSSVIRATLLFYLTPIWSTIIGVLWLSERLTPGRVAAIVLGLLGLYLLLSGSDGTAAPLNIGDAFALLSGMFWGMGAAMMKKNPGFPIASTALVQFLVAALLCALLGLFLFEAPVPPAEAIRAALPISLGASILVLLPSMFAIFWASKKLFPGRVGVLMMSEALVAIISASLLLPEETMTLWQWIGSTIILTACFVEVLTKDEKLPPEPVLPD